VDAIGRVEGVDEMSFDQEPILRAVLHVVGHETDAFFLIIGQTGRGDGGHDDVHKYSGFVLSSATMVSWCCP